MTARLGSWMLEPGFLSQCSEFISLDELVDHAALCVFLQILYDLKLPIVSVGHFSIEQ